MDSHTGVFIEWKWRLFSPLHRALSRRALLTIVTNDHLKNVVERWGAKAFVLEDPLPELRHDTAAIRFEPSTFNIAAIFSFADDEPVEEMLSVKDLPPEVRIHVTGDSSRVPRRLATQMASQMRLTGFVGDEEFDALVCQCDALVVLCTKPHTMLCGAYEAAAAGKPLITSDWPEMRAYFSRGTLFVDNSTASIEGAIREVRHRHQELANEMCTLRTSLAEAWTDKFTECLDQIGGMVTARVGPSIAAATARSGFGEQGP